MITDQAKPSGSDAITKRCPHGVNFQEASQANADHRAISSLLNFHFHQPYRKGDGLAERGETKKRGYRRV